MRTIRHRTQSLVGAALLVAMAGGPAIAQMTETGLATSSIYTGQEWEHTFVWPRGIERITTTGANGLESFNFRAKLTSIAGRTTDKIVCKREIEDPVVKELGGSSKIWTFVDYDPGNGVTCDPSEQLKRTVARPDTGPKTCTTTSSSIDCTGLTDANLPDEVSYRVKFPVADNRVVIFSIHLKGQTTPRQIRYVAGGCNWLTCP